MKKDIKTTDLIEVTNALDVGLRSGQDSVSVIHWLSQNYPNGELRRYFRELHDRMKLNSPSDVFSHERASFNHPAWKILVEVLIQNRRGLVNSSQVFGSMNGFLRSLDRVERSQKSLLMIPQLQAWSIVISSVLFVIALPLLFPGLFLSFFDFGRWDLFALGWIGLFGGLWLLLWLCHRPQRHLAPLLNTSSFFYMMALFVETGMDAMTAWSKSLEAVSFSNQLKQKLSLPRMNSEAFGDFLQSLENQLVSPWPLILHGLIWVLKSGIGVSSYLKQVSNREADRLLFSWENELRRLTVYSLFPLSFLVFPSALFLIIGPQFYGLFVR